MSEASPIKVLLVEDDERLGRLTARYLESHGLLVTLVPDGRSGLAEAGRSPPDVVLLDLMLPQLPGMEVCRQLRARSDVPIIMVTALGEEADRVLGLEGGADDYLPKPFSSRELLARIRAQARRARGQSGPGPERVQVGPLSIDVGSHSAWLDGRLLPLTSAELALLVALARRPGRVLSRDQLLDLTRSSPDEVFDRSIDVSISRIRQKMGDDPRSPRWLRTVRGAGYLLAAPGEG